MGDMDQVSPLFPVASNVCFARRPQLNTWNSKLLKA